MFKRLIQRWRNRKPPETEMVPVYGISSKHGPVILRYTPASEVKYVIPNENRPRIIRPHGLDNSSAAVKKRHRDWLVKTLPDECAFL